MKTLKINPRFKELCRRLTEEEFSQLEANIVNEGRVREEIVTWNGYIVDGHHRYEIATANDGVTFDTAKIEFVDENAACNWIIHNQLGRRNVNPQEASYLRGKLYLAEKKEANKPPENPRGQSDPAKEEPKRTAEKVAEETGVSAATVKRDGAKAEAIDKLPEHVREGILSKKYTATAAAIKKAGSMSIGEIGPVARKLRVGETTSLDEALGMKNGKKPTAAKPPAKKKGQPTNDVRLFDDLVAHVGKAVKMNTAIKDRMGGGMDHHETIRQHINGILETLKVWKHESGAA